MKTSIWYIFILILIYLLVYRATGVTKVANVLLGKSIEGIKVLQGR